MKRHLRRHRPVPTRHAVVDHAATAASRAASGSGTGGSAHRAGLLLNQAVHQHQTGQLAAAERLYQDVLRLVADQPDALHLLGVLALQRGRPADAVAQIRRAVARRPQNSTYHANLGVALQALGQTEDARASLERAVTLDPANVDAAFNLGVTLQTLGRLDEAVVRYRQTLTLRPGHAGALQNLGNTLHALGRADEAIPVLHQAFLANPTEAGLLGSLGTVLAQVGRTDEALGVFEAATRLAPADPAARLNLAVAYHQADRLPEAIDAYRAALALRPGHPEALHSLGRALRATGNDAEAAGCFEQALAALGIPLPLPSAPASERGTAAPTPTAAMGIAGPADLRVRLLCDLGIALKATDRATEALAAFRAAIAVAPDDAEAWYGLGATLQATGAPEEAIEAYERTLALDPTHADAHAKLIFSLDLLHTTTIADAFAARRRWNDQHARPLAGLARPHGNTPDPERRLRIGYVSADFYRHSASTAYLPILEAHDPSVVETFCYASNTRQDEQTAHFRAAADCWRDVAGLSDEALAALIRDDQIDILVDLSGHTAGNRLPVFARKPAPVQVTAWGYATGTGLDAMDVFFADPVIVPDEDRRWYAEEVVYLPALNCYAPPFDPPPVAPTPALARGVITFGSFNRPNKITAETLATWAEVLLAVPDARLVLKLGRQNTPETCARLLDTLAAHGIASERVEILGASSHTEHLAAYGQIDVQLDPFPHGGGVTTNESLLMGVPVVTLLGDRVPGRTSASSLVTVGLGDLVAHTPDEYVAIARRLAGDLPRLARERATLRERLLSSPIGDTVAYTRAVEAAYRSLWRRWCHQESRVRSQESGDASPSLSVSDAKTEADQ